MGLQAPQEIFGQDFRVTSTTKDNRLGVRGSTVDGRTYRYISNFTGAATLAAGLLAVQSTPETNHVNQLIDAAAAIGALKVDINVGATAAAADLYADGYLNIQDVTGEGILYLIEGHAAIDSSGIGTINLAEPIKVALVADSSEGSLIQNKFSNLVISVSDQADDPVGVPNIAIADDLYGWVQTGGPCSVLGDEVVAVGDNVTIGDSTGGAVSVVNADSEPLVGVCMQATVDGEYTVVDLKLES